MKERDTSSKLGGATAAAVERRAHICAKPFVPTWILWTNMS